MNNLNGSRSKTARIVHVSVFSALIAVCSWISIPFTVPFTLQLFAVFLAYYVLGSRVGATCVLVYMTLGMIGVPVFSGFTFGIGVLFSSTGGFLWGFLAIFPVFLVFERRAYKHSRAAVAALGAVSLFVCYAVGAGWFCILYLDEFSVSGVLSALSICVFPYILPDFVKFAMAVLCGKKILTIINKNKKSAEP